MKRLLLSIFISIFSLISLAEDTLVFGSFPIPLMVESEDKGVFVELTKAIAEKAGLKVQLKIAPPKRTVPTFLSGKLDAIFPALDVNFPPGTKVEKSANIYVKVDYVFTMKGQKALTSIADLKGKKVGITMGYPYVNELTQSKDFKLEVAPTDELNAKKLSKGRIDAFVVEEKSGIQAFEKANLKDSMQYVSEEPLSRQDVYYAFQATEKGKELAAKFSKALKELQKSGEFAKIMQKAAAK